MVPTATGATRTPARPGTVVLGMGATGAACARFFAARGERVLFADTRRDPPGLAAIKAALPDAELITGAFPPAVPPAVAMIVVSPGVDLSQPLLAEARRRGLEVLSDIDLFAREARAPIVGITGSNGKSTVTSMVGSMLAAAGVRAGVGGNLGTPALDLLDPLVRAYVLELSSFQLDRSDYVPLASAVLLNFSPDHLDVHGSVEAYLAAKARIYRRCAKAVVNRDEPGLANLVPAGVPRVSFGLTEPAPGEYGTQVRDGEIWLCRGSRALLATSALNATGRHNHANALAALALVETLGVALEPAIEGLRRYEPLPHRMALVARHAGVTWIDDSKATNVGAAATSINSVDGPLVLIAGGDAKGATFESIAAALAGRSCVAVLLGRDRELIAQALSGVCEVRRAPDMDAAVAEAARAAAPGHTVLLAPACSSLDMFSDYGARGEAFRVAVLRTTGAGA